jgi:hypothetical protein
MPSLNRRRKNIAAPRTWGDIMFTKITMLAGICLLTLSFSMRAAFADEGAARANVADPWTECGISVVVSADWIAAAMTPLAPSRNTCAGYGAAAASPKRTAQKSWRAILGEPQRAFAAHLKAKNRDPA